MKPSHERFENKEAYLQSIRDGRDDWRRRGAHGQYCNFKGFSTFTFGADMILARAAWRTAMRLVKRFRSGTLDEQSRNAIDTIVYDEHYCASGKPRCYAGGGGDTACRESFFSHVEQIIQATYSPNFNIW